MDSREVMKRVGAIIESHGTGLLATVDQEGNPHVRWLTPTILAGRPDVLYALTAPRFAKVVHLKAHPKVEWMFQTPTLDEVITVRGSMNEHHP
jgi:general stress protein 26